jgi:hypothetical protein
MYDSCLNRWDRMYINDKLVQVYNATWDARLNCSEIQKTNGTWYYWIVRPYINKNMSDPIRKVRIEVMNCRDTPILTSEYIVPPP